MGATKDLRRGQLGIRARPRRHTRAELTDLVSKAQAQRMTHVQIEIPRKDRPGARMRLNGQSSPWSDHQRGIVRVRVGLWAAWWSVETLSEWLGLAPTHAPQA